MGKKIMVVDDEPDTIELTKAVLEMSGFEVMAFNSAEDALKALESGKVPDMVILDMRMPHISGPDFCKRVRENPKIKDLKIVFFTASSFRDDDIAKKYGVLGYIFKPFDNDKLVKQINDFLAK